MTSDDVVFDDVSVSYGVTTALSHLSLTLRAGEIVGLLGHNGAGKSTLVNVATGAVSATSGSMRVGADVVPTRTSPAAMAAMGIAVIHQEPALAPDLSIVDNLFLARASRLSQREKVQLAHETISALGMDVDPNLPVAVLSLGQRQVVDLARASLQGSVRALFLDEPTAGLGREETNRLHALIRSFAAKGTAVAYVSHRLSDVLDVCDRIVVLRSGELVLDRSAKGLTVGELGRALAPDMETLEFRSSVPGRETVALPDLGMTFHAGEIVGLFGMAGGPQFDVIESIFGSKAAKYDCRIDGRPYVAKSPAGAIRRGIHMVQADRERDSLAPGLSARDNVMLPWISSYAGPLGIDARRMAVDYSSARSLLRIIGPSEDAPISAFSGGNRQKHVVARWTVARGPRILLLAQPTQGVDVQAKVDIVRALRNLTEGGTTIIVASAEGDEIASMCDRAYVIDRAGATPVPRSGAYEEDLVAQLLNLASLERELS